MQRQKKAFDKRHTVVDLRPLKPGEHVWVKDMNRRGTVKTHMKVPPRSYVVMTQHGDVRRNHRHLNPTLVAPTYDALPTDLTFQSTWAKERKNRWLSQHHLRENLNHLSQDVTLRESEICLPTCPILTLLSRVIDMKVNIHDGSCACNL